MSHTAPVAKCLSIALLSVLALTACKKEAPASNAPAETATQATPTDTAKTANAPAENANLTVYTVAIDPYYPPFEYLEKDGSIVGFDVDLLNAIGEKEGFKPDYQHNEILKIVNLVKDGQNDMGASSIFILPERKELIDYSNSYFEMPLVFLGLEKEGRPQSLDDIKNQKISVQKNIIMETIVDQDYVPKGNQKVGVKSNYLAFTEVLRGKSDLMLDNAVTIQGFLPKAEGKQTYTLQLPADKNLQLGYVVQKGNTELLNKLNSGLEKVKADGTYDKIYDKWFGPNSQYPIANLNTAATTTN